MLPPGIARAFRLAVRRRDRVAAETDDEIRFHLEMRVEALVARGMPRSQAEVEAVRRFGALEEVRPQLLAAARQREETLTMFERLDTLRDDARYALRQLRRAPGFTAALALTFALGIGANATMFQVIDRLLFRPPAFLASNDRTGRIYLRRPNPDGTERIDNNLSYLRFSELRDQTRAFDAVAAVFQDEWVIGTGIDARQGYVGLVSAGFWPMFDVRPEIGRFFGPDEDRPPRGSPVAVLGHGYWTTRFGGDPSVLGKPVTLGGRQHTIIGVAPRGFHGIWSSNTVAYVPITAAAFVLFGGERYYLEHNISWLEVIARRKPDVSAASANADLTRVFRLSRMAAAAARPQGGPIPPQSLALTFGEIAPLPYDRGPKARGESKVALWLGGVSVIVLLIACANVANLLLARALRRRREIAVRVALGVGRGRLVSQLLTESILLAAIGGLLGLVLAHYGGGMLRTLLLPDVDWSLVPAFDRRVLLFAAGAALVTGLLTGLAPVFHALRTDVNHGLKAGQREGAHRSQLRTGLLLAQAALSIVLLVGAGLFVRSLDNVRSKDLGWDPERVLFAMADLRAVQIDTTAQRDLVRRMVERARTIPGVTHAASAITVPFWRTWSEAVFVPGMDSASRTASYVLSAVSDQYFETMGTRLLRGRAVGDDDVAGAPRVAVVSESMAKQLWKGRDALGQCLRVGADTNPCTEVVGIAEDITRGDLRADDGLQFYIPAAQARPTSGLFIRSAGNARRIAERVRRELQPLMPGMGFADVRPMERVLDPIIRQWKLGATMFTVFGALALALAAIGLYGVIAYNVAQRSHEMGVRVALGAQRGDIRRLVLAQAIRIAAVGAVLGSVIAYVAVRYVEELLFDVPARDPLVFAAAVATILLVAVLASLVPARRATRVDPVVALRTD